MKVEIKRGLGGCVGHGRCSVLAGAVYRLDDDGYNADQGTIIEIDADHERAARVGAQNCPERAIIILDDAE